MTSEPPARGLGARFWKLWSAVTVSNVGDGVAAIAIPWLTTELTDSAFLVALMGLSIRLPWLLFSPFAGVWADRMDRRRLMVAANLSRAAVLAVAALLVWSEAMTLPVLLAISLALGCCEVVFDNTSQVILPAVVPDKSRLEAANGRLMSAQMVLSEFVGRPLTGVLVGVALTLPFVFDATAAVVSVLILLTVPGTFRAGGARPAGGGTGARPAMRREIGEGLRWLWSHTVLRRLAVALACANAITAGAFAGYVLYAREILGLGPFGFAVLTSVGALGGLAGGLLASAVSARIGPARSLLVTLGVELVALTAVGLTSRVWVVAVVGVLTGGGMVLWNVVTVSMRQSIIPDRLLGRVNSSYRLLGWGSMPLGMLAGGGLMTLVEQLAGREAGLRAPMLAGALLTLALTVYVALRLDEATVRAALETEPPAEEPEPLRSPR